MNPFKPVEHKFKAFVFWLFSPVLKRKADNFTALDGSRLSKVLFLRPEKIGDTVVSLPVFDGLKTAYPHIRVSILGSPRNIAVIGGDPRFDKVFLYRKKLWADVKTVLAIRRERYDAVVDMIADDSVTSLMLSQMSAPGKPRVGVGKVRFRDYYDFNYDSRRNNEGHIVTNTLQLLTAFGVDVNRVNCYAPPYVPAEDYSLASTWLAGISNGLQPGLTVGYNLSAGAPNRIWSDDNAERLLRQILAYQTGTRVILICVNEDRRRAEKLLARFAERVYVVPPKMSLKQVSAIISKLDLLISPDTSLVHIARTFKVPVVGLYSRFMKNFMLWRPFDQEVGSVVSDHDDNIYDITVERVFSTYIEVLAGRKLVAP